MGTLGTSMYKALNEAWEKQKQVVSDFTPNFLTWGDGFRAGWKAGLSEKEKGDTTS